MGAETSDPQSVAKRPSDSISESHSIRSKQSVSDRGVKQYKKNCSQTIEKEQIFIDHIQQKYDPNQNMRSEERRGNLMPIPSGMVKLVKSSECSRDMENNLASRVSKTTKNK